MWLKALLTCFPAVTNPFSTNRWSVLPPPTPRPYPDHVHYCLSHMQGSCGVCIDRCPAGAVSGEGHDMTKCFAHIYRKAPSVLAERYGLLPSELKVGSCGLCQTNVPCEARIPVTL